MPSVYGDTNFRFPDQDGAPGITVARSSDRAAAAAWKSGRAEGTSGKWKRGKAAAAAATAAAAVEERKGKSGGGKKKSGTGGS